MAWFTFVFKYLFILSIYQLFNHAQCQVPLSEFFPFNRDQTTTNVVQKCDDCSTDAIPLQVPFLFFNNSHNSLWLNNNGGISFVQAISQFTPSCVPQNRNFSMITPFWADVDTSVQGTVYFRQTSDTVSLDKASQEIRTAHPKFQNIQLAWAFIATWEDVRGYGLSPPPNYIPNPLPNPASNPIPNPTSNPTLNPTSNPTPNPASNPLPNPASNPIPNPTSNPIPNPTPNPTPNPASNPIPNPTSNPIPNPASNPLPNPASNPIPNPTPNPTPNPASNPIPNPTPNPTPNPASNLIPNPTSNPIPNPTLNPRLNPVSNPIPYPTYNITLNTFQVVLTTDLQNSFVIFYYNKIQWTKTAKIGFDAGDGDPSHIFMLNASCTSEIANVVSQSNYGRPGKFVFRVDQNPVFSSTCNVQWDSNQRLFSIPANVSPYGNEVIQFKGPCFNENDEIICIFRENLKNSRQVVGSIINKNTVACTPPFFQKPGLVDVQVEATSKVGNISRYNAVVYVLEQPRNFLEVKEIESQPEKVTLNWNPVLLKTEKIHLKLHIFDKDSEEWLAPITIEKNISNTGVYSVNKASVLSSLSVNEVFTVSLTTENLTRNALDIQNSGSNSQGNGNQVTKLTYSLFGNILNVVSSLNNAYLRRSSVCSAWHSLDKGPPTDLQPCPPTLRQAESDLRFEENNFLTSFYHQGADTCFRSVNPSSSGGGQQCCYKYTSSSFNGQRSGNIHCQHPSGGTADRFSPKNTPWRHFVYDVLPWFACCKFSDSCDKYYRRRPSDCGETYIPPRRTVGSGDPHFITFDGMEYTFNGHGEYWMMKTENCSVQVRIVPFESLQAQQNATVISAIAFKCKPSDGVFQFQLNPLRTAVTILLNSQTYSFENETDSVTIGKIEVTQRSEKFRVSFEESTFLISFGESALIVEGVGCNGSYPKTVRGLLGNCDQERKNDLQTPDGLYLNVNSTLSEIHYNFGEKWRIRSEESLFTYNRDENYLTFYHPEFIPTLYEPDPSSFSQVIRDVCGDSKSCYFDYSVTKSLTFANQTKKSETIYKAQVVEDSKAVIMCTPPSELVNGYRIYNNYLPGSSIQTVCNEGYELRGQAIVVCADSGQWTNQFPTCELKQITTSSQSTHRVYLLSHSCLFIGLMLFYFLNI